MKVCTLWLVDLLSGGGKYAQKRYGEACCKVVAGGGRTSPPRHHGHPVTTKNVGEKLALATYRAIQIHAVTSFSRRVAMEIRHCSFELKFIYYLDHNRTCLRDFHAYQ